MFDIKHMNGRVPMRPITYHEFTDGDIVYFKHRDQLPHDIRVQGPYTVRIASGEAPLPERITLVARYDKLTVLSNILDRVAFWCTAYERSPENKAAAVLKIFTEFLNDGDSEQAERHAAELLKRLVEAQLL